MNIKRNRMNHPLHILVAEDDPDDQMLIHDAFEANNLGKIGRASCRERV